MRNPFRWFVETFPLEKRGQTDFSKGLQPRPSSLPPMHRGSIFPHFDIDVPMPKGTAEPRA